MNFSSVWDCSYSPQLILTMRTLIAELHDHHNNLIGGHEVCINVVGMETKIRAFSIAVTMCCEVNETEK